MRRLVWLDLCCGLKGASQPAIDRGWKVITVDIDPRFKPDIVADVRALPLKPFHVDVLWASPPCQEFSKWGMRCFNPNPKHPDLSIALAFARTICDFRHFHPWWILENVWASRPWLSRIFGPVAARVPGHAFWSNRALLLPNLPPHKGSFHAKHNTGKRWGVIAHGMKPGAHNRSIIPHLSRAPAEAAKIPYEIGEAICRALEQREHRVSDDCNERAYKIGDTWYPRGPR